MRFFAVLLAIVSSSAFAQYKCTIDKKTVIQDQPCPGARRSETMPLTYDPLLETANKTLGNTDAIEQGKAICSSEGPRRLAWKDPDSVKVGEASGGKMVSYKLGSKQVAARIFAVQVNAKNSYGGYTGFKPLFCYTSPDGHFIYGVSASAMD